MEEASIDSFRAGAAALGLRDRPAAVTPNRGNTIITRIPFLAAIALATLNAATAGAQEAEPGLRASYRRGLEGLGRGDYEAYVSNFERAVDLIPRDDLNRPFLQYHLARAHALTGDSEAAARLLETILEEGIESLMVYYATLDPAFDSVRDSPSIQQAMARMRDVEVEIEPIRGSVYLLRGAGSNLVASIGPDGTLLVDAGYAPAASSIRHALATLGADPPGLVVNTHHHEDHTGGNAELARGGVVVAHPATRAAMRRSWEFIPGVEVPAKTEPALPLLTSEGPLSLHFNGEEVRLVPLPGHTAGDLIVHFIGSRVVHMGDRFFPGARRHIYPGEDPDSYVSTMEALLLELTPDTRVVSGHDAIQSVDALRAAHRATVEAIDWIRHGIAEGRPLEELQAEGASRGLSGGWIAGVHRGLVAGG